MWCVARLFVRAASGRKRYNVLGALDAVTHRLIRVTNHDYINAESVCALLRAVAEAFRGVADHAGAGQRAVPEVRLGANPGGVVGDRIVIPSKLLSNLNLIERLWRFVRKESLNSTYYESSEQFTTAIDQCLDGLHTVHKGEMETLMTHKFQMFGEVPLLAA